MSGSNDIPITARVDHPRDRRIRWLLGGVSIALLIAATQTGCASRLERARSAHAQGDDEKAEELYQKSIAAQKDDADLARRELVEMKVELGRKQVKKDPVKGEQLFREALALDGSSEPAKDGLGRALKAQGKTDAAVGVLAGESEFGACSLCGRYLAVVLLERAAERENAKELQGALDDYKRAVELVPQPDTWFAISRVQAALGDGDASVAAVEEAAKLIQESDTLAQEAFVRVREKVVLKALTTGDVALADRFLKIFPPGSGGERWYTLQLQVAREQYRRKDTDGAMARIEPFLGPEHTDTLPESHKPQFEKLLSTMYQARGTSEMHAGKPAVADEWFTKAMKLEPESNKIRLLRALALAGQRDVDTGLKIVETTPDSAAGRAEIEAILYSMKVHNLIDAGQLDAAKETLTRAQASNYEQPEVHVAMAALLAETPAPKPSRKDAKILKRDGVVDYPDGEINRYGEALSELAWARAQADSQGERYPYRGPEYKQRAQQLEQRIRAFYPYPVKFNEDSNTVLTFEAAGGGKDIEIDAPNGQRESVFAAAGKQVEVTIQTPGLVTIKVGKQRLALYTEPYTHLHIKL